MKNIIAGIYQIRNKVNGNRYIGSSVNLFNRFYQHKNLLRANKSHSPYLQNAWNKYGEENFEFIVMIYCDREMVLFYEQIFLDKLMPEYNSVNRAESMMLGAKFSEEHKNKIRLWHIGRTASDETKEKLRLSHLGQVAWNKGKKTPESTKEKIRIANLGKKQSEETIQKRREIICTDETKRKMSVSQKEAWRKRKNGTP